MKESTLISSGRETGFLLSEAKNRYLSKNLSIRLGIIFLITLFCFNIDLYAQLHCEHVSETFATSDPSCPGSEDFNIAKIDRSITDEILYVKAIGSACCGNFLVNPKSGNDCFLDTSIAGPSGPDVVITEVGTVPDTCNFDELLNCSPADDYNDILEIKCSDGVITGHRITFLGFIEDGTESYWYYHVENNVNGCMNNISHLSFGVVDDSICCVDLEAGTGTDDSYCISDEGLSGVDLDALVSGGDPGGEWTDGSDAVISSPIDLSSFVAGSYTFTYTVSPSDEGSDCPEDTTEVTITIYDDVEAGTGSDDSYCISDEGLSGVDLDALVSGGDPGGEWTDGSDAVVSSPIDLSSFVAGSYIFTYTVSPSDEGSDCPEDATEVTITIDPLPAIPDYQTSQADCLGT